MDLLKELGLNQSIESAEKLPQSAAMQAAARAMERCDLLAECTESPGMLTRTFGSAAMHTAHVLTRRWMTDASMTCRLDAATNLIGRYESPHASGKERRPRILICSHLDSVVNAGKYDGPLGVLMGIAVVEMLCEAEIALPFDVEVVGFCEEEGVRFQTPYIGSSALVGRLTSEMLSQQDSAGTTLAQAIREFGGDPEKLAAAAVDPRDVIAYIEPHIEQGPRLENESLPVGIVTGIVGQSRASLQFIGTAAHAGTVSMTDRRDALAAGAELILAVERIAIQRAGLVATVGRIEVAPNVGNVIPASATLRLDVRHIDDATRQKCFEAIIAEAIAIASRRKIEFSHVWKQEQPATMCDAALTEKLQAAVVASGVRPLLLPSGAGHDVVALADVIPSQMLFLRCRGGISHHPDESVAEHDVAVALDILFRFVVGLAETFEATQTRDQSR